MPAGGLSGHVVDIEMGVALGIGAARGYDLCMLSELLPAAEAGLIEAVYADREQGRRAVGADGVA